MRRRRRNPELVAQLKSLTHEELVTYCEAVLVQAARGEQLGPAPSGREAA